jgi:peroxiredoxin
VPLFPRQPVPPLNVNLAGGGSFDLGSEKPAHFMLLFYRGLHCPICKTQLRELESKLEEFDKRGVAVVAVSSDTKERAAQTREAWGLTRLRIGYGLDLAAARRWGLFISSGRGMTSAGVEEPARFSEPALYLIRPDGTLYFGSVQCPRDHIIALILELPPSTLPAESERRRRIGCGLKSPIPFCSDISEPLFRFSDVWQVVGISRLEQQYRGVACLSKAASNNGTGRTRPADNKIIR